MQSNQLVNLAGPKEFIYYKIGDNKLLLIGEDHNYVKYDKNYYDIHKWLKDIIESTDSPVDLYLEEDEVNYLITAEHYSSEYINIGEYSKPLDAIRCYFSKYQRYNFMLHKIDPRILFSGKSILPDIYLYIRNLDHFNYFDMIDIEYYAQENCVDIVEYLCGICRDERNENIYFEYLNKIKDFFPNIENIDDDKHTELFWNLIDRKIINLDIDKFNKIFLDIIRSTFNPEEEAPPFSVTQLACCQMDYFSLLEYISNPSKISIFYCGSVHINFLAKFISIWYAEDGEEIESELYKYQSGFYPNHIIFDEPFDLLE